jgi:hypothetical protein
MGNIKEIIARSAVPPPMHNTRLAVELCENVHLHYRNLRLEFGKEEFIRLLSELKKIDVDAVSTFDYGENKFECLLVSELPERTEWNHRMQLEEQDGGGYHFHYRNLRIETLTLKEIGYTNTQITK